MIPAIPNGPLHNEAPFRQRGKNSARPPLARMGPVGSGS